MKKLLHKIFISSFIILCSCKLPSQVIEPKMNGIKINQTFKNISGMSIDSNDNLYIIANNIIKRIDAKTEEITLIAGKEKPDFYPKDGNIDGDINTAKFGTIQNVVYAESENAVYFLETTTLDNKNCNQIYLVRKIYNNKITTLIISNKQSEYQKECVDSYSKLNIKSQENLSRFFYDDHIYMIDNLHIKKLTNNIFEIVKSFENISSYSFLDDQRNPVFNNDSYYFLDNQLNLYSVLNNDEKKTTSLYVRLNESWKKIIESDKSLSFLVKNGNVYIIDNNLTIFQPLRGGRIRHFWDFLEPSFDSKKKLTLHMINKNQILESKTLFDLSKNQYLIGELDLYTSPLEISNDGLKLYTSYNDSIYKVKIEMKK